MVQTFKFLGVVFFGFAAAFVLVAMKNLPPGPAVAALPPARATSPAIISSAPSPETDKASVYNLDVSERLEARSAKFADHADYTFSVSPSNGAGEKVLLTKTVGPAATMSVPANSWSPDSKEVFIILKDGSLTNYLVFKASGESYNPGDQFLELSSLFAKTNNKLTLKNVTGWDGYGLLHVETANPDGSRGPNFWFVTGTRQFLELAKAPNE